jgi:hypothetical protein
MKHPMDASAGPELLWGEARARGAGEEDLSRLRFLLPSMKKSELLRALQTEIQKHNLSTFVHEQHRVTSGCSFCRKHFGTVEQFKFLGMNTFE